MKTKQILLGNLIIVSNILSACISSTQIPTATLPLTVTETATQIPTSTSTALPIPSATIEVPNNLEPCFDTENPEGTFGCLVTTIAGGNKPNIGDGGQATNAILAGPYNVEIGPNGELYISDSVDNRIRMVDSNGMISTLIGIGTAEAQSPIDGLLAQQTLLRRPRGMTFGPDGMIYYVENKFHIVRVIRQDGTVQTVAGMGSVYETRGDDGPALSASLLHPADLIFDKEGNLYIAESTRHRVRVIDTNGIIHTIAGNGDEGDSGDGGPAIEATLKNPESLAFDQNGDLIIGGGGRIRIVDIETGMITGISNTDGAAFVAVGPNNEIYASFPGINIVAKIERNGRRIIVAGTGVAGYNGDGLQATQAQVNFPAGLAVDSEGNVYLADRDNFRVRRINPEGIIETVAGSDDIPGDNVPYYDAVINSTNGLVFDRYGNLFFSDFDYSTIRRLGTDGFITTVAGDRRPVFAGDGGHPLQASFNSPRALIFDHAGNLLFIDESSDSEVIRRITPGSDGVINGGPDEVVQTVVGVPGGFNSYDKKFDEDLPAYQASFAIKVDNVPGNEAILWNIRGLTIDSMGNLYIAGWLKNQIYKVTPGADRIINAKDDEVVSIFAGNGDRHFGEPGKSALNTSIPSPWWLAVDSHDNLYVFSYELEIGGKLSILKIDSETNLVSQLLSSRGPSTFAINSNDFLYLTDSMQTFRVNSSTGEKTLVIAGTGVGGWSGIPGEYDGDNGDARYAKFSGIQYLALDLNGDVYLNDAGNLRIRKITFASLKNDQNLHPVNTVIPETPPQTPLPVEVLPGPTQIVFPPETLTWTIDKRACPVEDSVLQPPSPRLRCLGRIFREDGPPNPEYAFYAEGFNPAMYPTEQWYVTADCKMFGKGAYGQVITIEISRQEPQKECTLSFYLPNQVGTEAYFLHDPTLTSP